MSSSGNVRCRVGKDLVVGAVLRSAVVVCISSGKRIALFILTACVASQLCAVNEV